MVGYLSRPRRAAFFFHNEIRGISQWKQPLDLRHVLGEWRPGGSCWRNDLLHITLSVDPRQTTNIFQAALDGNVFFLQLYAEADGDLNVVDATWRRALHFSCAGGSTQSAAFLLQRRAVVDGRDQMSSTPLVYACRYGYASVAKLLLDAAAEMSLVNGVGDSPLHEAAAMGHLDCVHLLLLYGANTSVVNRSGETAADVAANRMRFPCLKLLRGQCGRSAVGTSVASDQSGRKKRERHKASMCQGDESDDVGNAPDSSDGASSGSADDRPRTRDRPPVALGLLNRVQWLPKWLDTARRHAFPIHADLGEPNQFTFNEELGCWELPDTPRASVMR